MRIVKSNKLSDIIEVNQRSIHAQSEIRIIELSSLSDLIEYEVAEDMRMQWRDRAVKIRQLTNRTTFEPWTEVNDFVGNNLTVRHVTQDVLPINAEVLIYDEVVAFYRVKPTPTVLVVEDKDFADEQRALFDAIWLQGDTLALNPDGSTQGSSA